MSGTSAGWLLVLPARLELLHIKGRWQAGMGGLGRPQGDGGGGVPKPSASSGGTQGTWGQATGWPRGAGAVVGAAGPSMATGCRGAQHRGWLLATTRPPPGSPPGHHHATPQPLSQPQAWEAAAGGARQPQSPGHMGGSRCQRCPRPCPRPPSPPPSSWHPEVSARQDKTTPG